MTKFLALYRSDLSTAEQFNRPSEDQQTSMNEWMAWFTNAGAAITDGGAPLSGDDDHTVTGYSIIEAESLSAAREVVRSNPHLKIGSIELFAFVDAPAM